MHSVGRAESEGTKSYRANISYPDVDACALFCR